MRYSWVQQLYLQINAAFQLAGILLVMFLLTPPVHAEESSKEPPPTIHCQHRTDTITIDGVLDEFDWVLAPSFALAYTLNPSSPQEPTTAYASFIWDEQNLYIGIVAEDRQITATCEERDGPLWLEDVLEVFIKPSAEQFTYYEFEISPKRALFDACLKTPDTKHNLETAKSWNTPLQFAVTINGTLNNPDDIDQSWQLELAIPIASLISPDTVVRNGSIWEIAVCRYDYPNSLSDPLLTSTAPLRPEFGFHDTERYQQLQFTDSLAE